MSGGAVKPRMAAPGGSGGRPAGQARTGAPQPGSEPVRHPTPAK